MRYRNLVCRPFFLLLMSFVFSQVSGNVEAADAAMAWHEVPGKYTELRLGDRPILRYMHLTRDESTEQSRYETKKVFHHIYSPSGDQLLTNGPTGDLPYSKDVKYPHHRGLYYGFNRITYGDDKQADTWHCHKGESEQHEKILDQEVGPDFGRHRLAINWHGKDGEVFAKEVREVTAKISSEGTLIDFVSTLTPTIDGVVHFNGDPQHAGVQFRAIDEVASKTAAQSYYIRTDGKGKLGETRNWDHINLDAPGNAECTDRPWNALSFVVGDNRFTAVYLDHPKNPKPAHYSEREYGRFGSYFVTEATKEKPLKVKYRLWLQAGEMTVEECAALSNEFVGK